MKIKIDKDINTPIPFKELKNGEIFAININDTSKCLVYFMRINSIVLGPSTCHNVVNLETGKTTSMMDDFLVIRINGYLMINGDDNYENNK